MKKMLLGAFLGMFAVTGIAVLPNYASAQDGQIQAAGWDGSSSEWGSSRYEQSAGATQWSREQQDVSYNPNVKGKDTFQSDNLIITIRKAINWVLGILSFIALALCLWGGFQMMTSGGDSKKYESGLNLLKWAAIGLAVIAVSRLIVSLVFYVINGSIETNDTPTQNG